MTTPPSDGDQAELADAVRTTVTRLSRELRQQAEAPFTATQLSVLGEVHRCGCISLGELAARERLSAPMISKVVTALEEHQMIQRSLGEHDRRVCVVRVSEAGRQWIDEELARWNERLATRLVRLDPQERAVVAAALPLLARLTGDDT